MLSRRLFGLIAAYAIAMQAVLAVVPVLPAAGSGIASLCTVQDGATIPAVPAGHEDQQCCVAAGCHGAPAVTPQDAAPAPALYAGRARLAEGMAPAIAAIANGRPHWPRAPPV